MDPPISLVAPGSARKKTPGGGDEGSGIGVTMVPCGWSGGQVGVRYWGPRDEKRWHP